VDDETDHRGYRWFAGGDRGRALGVDEAISRAVSLRLVSIMKQTHPSPDDFTRDLVHAETSLREAQFAVEAGQKSVKIEIEIPRGPAGPVLVEASRDAEMICVGSSGSGAMPARSWVRRQPNSLKRRTVRSLSYVQIPTSHRPTSIGSWCG
jgi:nucleotide-binding universal stress UspA family protein